MDANKIITVHNFRGQLRALIPKSDIKTYAAVQKTKLVNEIRIGKRIIKEEINPLIIVVGRETVCMIPRFMTYYLKLEHTIKLAYTPIVNPVDGFSGIRAHYTGTISENKTVLIEKVINQLQTIGGATLKLNTGKGKSVIASYLIHHFHKHAVLIAYSESLQDQLREEIVTRMGDSVNIILIGSKHVKQTKALLAAQLTDDTMITYLGDKLNIFISIYQSAHKLSDIFWKYIHLTVFDESHCYCNTTGINLVENCTTPLVLGLSATPEYDWRSPMTQYWCGPIINGDEHVPDRDLKGKVSIISYHGPKIYTTDQRDSTGKRSNTLMVKLLSEDPTRNKLILDNIKALLLDNYVIIVFAGRIDMLEKLNVLTNTLIKSMHNREYLSGLLVGGVPSELQREIKTTYDVIFTNYLFTRVGVNIPRATAIILASPYKNNGKQINGRILRSDDPKLRRYIDIVDENTPLKRQLTTRKQDYLDRKFEIETMNFP
jgi:superfamily II DNA or RNA helicase